MLLERIKNSKTLLSEFLNNKIEGYREPKRKGVNKGRKIGLSKGSYIASLLFLMRLPQKEIAKEAKISYGYLRLLLLRKEFKEKIFEQRREFAEVVTNFVREEIAKLLSEKKGGSYERNLDAIRGRLINKIVDMHLYNHDVFNRIKEEIIRELNSCILKLDEASHDSVMAGILFVNFWLEMLVPKSHQWRDLLKKLVDVLLNLSIERDKDIVKGFLNLLISYLDLIFQEQEGLW